MLISAMTARGSGGGTPGSIALKSMAKLAQKQVTAAYTAAPLTSSFSTHTRFTALRNRRVEGPEIKEKVEKALATTPIHFRDEEHLLEKVDETAKVPQNVVDVVAEEGKSKILSSKMVQDGDDYTLPHPIWSKEEAERVQITHRYVRQRE